jgi:hypothetical protein
MPLLFLFFVIFAFMGIGCFLIIGTIRKVDFLVTHHKNWLFIYPDDFLVKLFGEKSIYYANIFVGVVFLAGAFGIILYVLSFR